MALTLEISTNGGSSWNTDRTSELVNKSLRITDVMESRATATFGMVDTAGTAAPPQAGQPVRLTDGAGTPFVYFAGSIDRMDITIPTGNDAIFWQITAVDYTQILDRHLVKQKYEDKTLAEMVTDIVDNFVNSPTSEGITYAAPTTDTTETIDEIVFNYVTAAAAIERLAVMGGYVWRVGTDKAITFQQRTDATAAVDLTDGASSIALANSIRATQNRQQYRNIQYVTGSYGYTASLTNGWSGDGETTSFATQYPVGQDVTATADVGSGFASVTIGVQGVASTEFVYEPGGSVVSNGTHATLAAGQYLRVTYKGIYPTVGTAQDTAEIDARKAIEGGSGIYEVIETGADIRGSAVLDTYMTGLLERYGVMPSTVSYATDTAGLIAGTLQQTDLSRIKLLNSAGTAVAISDQYLVESVNATDIGGGTLRYSVKSLSGDAVGGWEKFFTDLKNANKETRFDESTRIDLARNVGPDTNAYTDSIASPSAAPESDVGTALVAYSEAA